MIGRPRLDRPRRRRGRLRPSETSTSPIPTSSALTGQRPTGQVTPPMATFLDVIAGPGPAIGPVTCPEGPRRRPNRRCGRPERQRTPERSERDVFVLEAFSNSGQPGPGASTRLGNYVTWLGRLTPYRPTGHQRLREFEFNTPKGIAVDSLGNVYVADHGQRPDPGVHAPAGDLLTRCSDGEPDRRCVDSSDVIYVAGNNRHLDRVRHRRAGGSVAHWAPPGAWRGRRTGVADRWIGQRLGHDVGERAIKEYDNLGVTLLGTYGSGVLVRQRSRSRSRRAARSTSPTPATDASSGSPVAVLPRSSGASTRQRGSRRADRHRRRRVGQRVHHEEGDRSDPEVRRGRQPPGGVRRYGKHDWPS